jgi:hypothetical protein
MAVAAEKDPERVAPAHRGLTPWLTCSALELLSNHRISSIQYNLIEFIKSNSLFWAIKFVSNREAKFDQIFDDSI